jgi:hypothetical protein
MPEPKMKKATRARFKKAANSPEPTGPLSTCGHSGCVDKCNVSYHGPTTHVRDHQIHMAAAGVRHIWTASVVAGLAVVLTGTIAYSAVEAKARPTFSAGTKNDGTAMIMQRLDRLEAALRRTEQACLGEEEGVGMNDVAPSGTKEDMMPPQEPQNAKEGMMPPQGSRPGLGGKAMMGEKPPVDAGTSASQE